MIFLFILLLVAIFLAGVLASPKIAATNLVQIDLRAFSGAVDYWANRYQTFLGVLVAIGVAYLTISAMTKQNSISERQFLSGQMQSLLADKGTLQFVISQLNEAKMQRVLFENNISFLDTAGDQMSGWQNGGNLIRPAFANVEGFRALVSANTAKFIGPTKIRLTLIAKLDAIVGSQDEIREAFLNWANLNRNANADPGAPAPPQKVAYLQTKQKVITLFDELLPLAKKATEQLGQEVDQTEKDIATLQKAINSKKAD
jgi:hypothetical protein